jgi:hypothetical protein
MTFSKADRVTIERLIAALDALAAAQKERTKQLKASSRVEMKRIRMLTELLEPKPRKQPARRKAS